MNSKIKDESVDFLFQAILSLKTVDECYNFFEDLCTVPEIKAMSQRLLVAHMLSTKRVYSDIVAETGASTATISRVDVYKRQWVHFCWRRAPKASALRCPTAIL